MARIILGISALVIGWASPAFAADYWPMEDGLIWSYQPSIGVEYEVSMGCVDGSCSRGRTIVAPSYTLGHYVAYGLNEEGDVVVTGATNWDSRQFDPDIATYDPPLLFLDLPLDLGKTWISISGPAVVVGEVLRGETVTVGAGTFEVLVVRVTDVANPTAIAGEYRLNRNVGAVMDGAYGLASFSGAVGAAPESWGSVKALFR